MKSDNLGIISKIQKLLNTADTSRNSSLEEASTAMNMAHKLLRKHHISMSQVLEVDTERNSSTDYIELAEIDAVTYAANILPRWLELIIKAINRITQTKTLIKRSPRKDSSCGNLTIVFIGDNLDATMASELFNFLKSTVSNLSTAHSKKCDGKFKHWRSFAEGCSNTLLERADELERKLDSDINRDSLFNRSKFSVDARLVDDDDDDLEDVDDIEDETEDESKDENFSIELYNKYTDTKIEKIKEYLGKMKVENEKSSSTSTKIEVNSFEQGQIAGEKIPLKLAQQITKSKRSK